MLKGDELVLQRKSTVNITSQLMLHPEHAQQQVTFTRIFPFKSWGLGSCLGSPVLTDDKSSLSPNISFRYWAIFFCCWILQWFSMDSITGNLKTKPQTLTAVCGDTTAALLPPHLLIKQLSSYTNLPHSFLNSWQPQGSLTRNPTPNNENHLL